MSDAGFTLLWSKTLRSSLWVKESKETRLVWLTMLMLKNADGVVVCSLPGLADAAKVTDEECESALSVLLSPDPKSTSKAEEGRRVLEVPGGWRIVNSDLYRFSTEAKRAFWAQQKAEQRAKEPQKVRKPRARKGPQAGETAYVKTLENEGPEAADKQMEHQERIIAEAEQRVTELAKDILHGRDAQMEGGLSISSTSDEEAKMDKEAASVRRMEPYYEEEAAVEQPSEPSFGITGRAHGEP